VKGAAEILLRSALSLHCLPALHSCLNNLKCFHVGGCRRAVGICCIVGEVLDGFM